MTVVGIKKLIEQFTYYTQKGVVFFFGYGTKERQIVSINEHGIELAEEIRGVTHNKIIFYNFLMDEWGQIWYIYAKSNPQIGLESDEMIHFEFTTEEKNDIVQMDTAEDLAKQDFIHYTSDDERELNENKIKFCLSESYKNKLKRLAGLI